MGFPHYYLIFLLQTLQRVFFSFFRLSPLLVFFIFPTHSIVPSTLSTLLQIALSQQLSVVRFLTFVFQ
jgi:hypothetical protein